MFDKALGSFYGVIIGDILGNTYRDLKTNDAKKKIIHNTENNILTIVKGNYYLDKGQISCNCEMSMAMIHCLYKYKDYIKEHIYQYYKLWWLNRSRDLDVKKFNHFDNSTNYSNLIQNSNSNYKNNYNNSCLMRVTPLAIFGHNISIEKLKQYISYDCNMTNPNIISIDRVTIYILSIRDALNGLSKTEIYKNAIKNCKRVENKYILENAKIRPQSSINDNLIYNDDNEIISNSCIAFQNTFFELLHSTNFHNSMVSIINRGGDTNTNCSIAGGLLGAYYGINDIPNSWKYIVKNIDKNDFNRINRIKKYQISSTLDIDKLVNGIFYPHKITIFNNIYCVNNNSYQKNTMTIKSSDIENNIINEDKYRKKIDNAIIKIKHIFNNNKYQNINIDQNIKYPKDIPKRINFYLKIKLSKLIQDLNTKKVY